MEMTPIENVLRSDTMRAWSDDYIALCKYVHETRGSEALVDFHKRLLGRQTKAFSNGEFRFWMWRTERWTANISKFKGICFEVPEECTEEQALAAWQDYKRAIGAP